MSFKGFHGLSARVSPFNGTLHRNGRGLEVQFLYGGGKGENKESRGDGESKHREEKQREQEGGLSPVYPTLSKRSSPNLRVF